MLLIWLMHYDQRWKFIKSVPLFNYFWILTSIIKILQVFQSNDEQRNFILIIESVIAIKLQININRKKQEKQIHLYRKELQIELTDWIQKKILKGMIGQTAFLLSIIDLFWMKQDYFTFITFIPVLGTLISFIVIKVNALILSWAFPSMYIGMKRKKN